VDLRRERVKIGTVGDVRAVFWSAVFREIVNVQQKSLAL
jgi:hypothetical protein